MWKGSRPLTIHVLCWAGAIAVAAARAPSSPLPTIQAGTLAAWTRSVAATESRIAREVVAPDGFLASDFDPSARADRQKILGRTLVIRQMPNRDASGDIDVPDGMVHHWRGAVLIHGATLDDLLARLESEPPGAGQDDVLQSAILERDGDHLVVFLKIRRKKIVTAVYDTEHAVTFRRLSATHATSASQATKIAELDHPDTANERELGPGEDRGFLWRWNAYWRYEQVNGGVIAECESLSLSRGVPWLARPFVGPIVEGTARESMEHTLASLSARYGR